MKKVILMCTFFLLGSRLAGALGNNYGSAEFLAQGVGARATGMGGAFVALADDMTSGYWNPAGLGQMELYLYYLGFQYALLAPDMHSYYASYAWQLPEVGCFSLTWVNCSILDIEARDEEGEVTQKFNSMENAVILSYGRKFHELAKGLYLGANLKILHQSMLDSQAVGYGFDLGAIWQPVLYWDHTLGINIQNIAQNLYWQTGSKHVDRGLLNLKVGTALKFLPSEKDLFLNHLVTTLDFDFSEYYRFGYHLGVEYWYSKSLAVRGGYRKEELSAGASYSSDVYEIDYTFIYDLSKLGFHQHRLSLFLRFK